MTSALKTQPELQEHGGCLTTQLAGLGLMGWIGGVGWAEGPSLYTLCLKNTTQP